MKRSLSLNILALIAGCLLVFAFAPFGFYPLAVISSAIILILWLTCTPTQGFIRGLLFGVGLFALGASWIFVSIHRFGNANIFLAGFITVLFVFILALFFAVQGFLLARFFPAPTLNKLLLIFPASWVLIEWLRTWIFFGGFPWLLLGATQTSSPLRGFAPIIGEFGISFLVVFSSVLLILIGIYFSSSLKKLIPVSTRQIIFTMMSLFLIWSLGEGISFISWTTPFQKPFQVALIQGNIPQQMKWTSEYINKTLRHYMELTRSQWDKPLIVWPETAVPVFKNDAQDFLNELSQKAKNENVTLITGIPLQDGFNYYNAAVALGTGQGEYRKRHLVPFGEYIPLTNFFGNVLKFFDIPMSSFSEGSQLQSLMQMPGIKIGMYICYEIAYPSLVLSDLPQANLLITISDDAWFGDSFAPAQHLQIGQMRSLETGRYLLFSTNSGITAIINPQGKIIARAPEFQSTVLTGVVQGMTGVTPWMKLGVGTIMSVLLGLLILGMWLEWRARA